MNVFVFLSCLILQSLLFAQNSSKEKIYCGSKKQIIKPLDFAYQPKGLLKNHKPKIALKKTYTFPETKARKLKKRKPPRKNGCIAAAF